MRTIGANGLSRLAHQALTWAKREADGPAVRDAAAALHARRGDVVEFSGPAARGATDVASVSAAGLLSRIHSQFLDADSNRDWHVSSDEAAAAGITAEEFARLDGDGDGLLLGAQEFAPAMLGRWLEAGAIDQARFDEATDLLARLAEFRDGSRRGDATA